MKSLHLATICILTCAIACETYPPNIDYGDCGGMVFGAPTPGSSCVFHSDCGELPTCVAPRCVDNVCQYEFAPVDMACDQCNVSGACDGAGACVEPEVPST